MLRRSEDQGVPERNAVKAVQIDGRENVGDFWKCDVELGDQFDFPTGDAWVKVQFAGDRDEILLELRDDHISGPVPATLIDCVHFFLYALRKKWFVVPVFTGSEMLRSCCATPYLWLNKTGTPTKSVQARGPERRKSNIKNLDSGTSGFSRPWRCPAAKSRSLFYSADSTGIPRSLRPSMPDTFETREDHKLGLAAEILSGCGAVRLKAWGVSMLPSVWPGDLLTIQSAAYGEVVPGDIVLVLRDNRFFLHRFVGQDGFLLITKGDAMPHNDPPVATCELLGRVHGIHRGNRSFVPSRRVSPLQSALAWVLCRWGPLRNLTLRVHAARVQAGPPHAGQVFRSLFAAVRAIPDICPSRTSLP